MDMNLTGNKLTVLEKQTLSTLSRFSSTSDIKSIRDLVKVSLDSLSAANRGQDEEEPQLVNSVAAVFGIKFDGNTGERTSPYRNLDELVTSSQIKELETYFQRMDGDWKFTNPEYKGRAFHLNAETQFADVVMSAVVRYVEQNSTKFAKRLKPEQQVPEDYEVVLNEFHFDPTYSKGYLVVRRVKLSFRSGYICPVGETLFVEEVVDLNKERIQDKYSDYDYSDKSQEVFELDEYDDYER